MSALFITPGRLLLIASALVVSSGCKLTSVDVEPTLPAVPVNNSATLVYRANGVPVVANNSTSLGTVLASFFGDPRAVSATWPAGGSLKLIATDIQNQPQGYLTHSLQLVLSGFQGVGSYSLLPAGPSTNPYSHYWLTTFDSDGHPIDHAEQYPVAGLTAQVTITAWDAANRHVAGTFEVSVAVQNNTQNLTHLTEGAFDLKVD